MLSGVDKLLFWMRDRAAALQSSCRMPEASSGKIMWGQVGGIWGGGGGGGGGGRWKGEVGFTRLGSCQSGMG